MNRRLAAVVALVLFAASVVLAVLVGVQRFPRGLSVLACVVVALAAAWWALVRRGWRVSLVRWSPRCSWLARWSSLCSRAGCWRTR